MRRHTGVMRCCQRSTLRSGARPCSTNNNAPFGFRTRRISRNAAAGSGIEHSVHVITERNGFRGTDRQLDRHLGGRRARARDRDQTWRRIKAEHMCDGIAVERKVQSRADADLQHLSARRADHSAAIFRQRLLLHDEIKDRWKNSLVVEAHGTAQRLRLARAARLVTFFSSTAAVALPGCTRRPSTNTSRSRSTLVCQPG
jgi:hypothetical protein